MPITSTDLRWRARFFMALSLICLGASVATFVGGILLIYFATTVSVRDTIKNFNDSGFCGSLKNVMDSDTCWRRVNACENTLKVDEVAVLCKGLGADAARRQEDLKTVLSEIKALQTAGMEPP